jgi:hypothetical protein
MATIGLILLCFAFVFACIASRFSSVGGWNMLAIAIAFWILAEIFGGAFHGLVHY